MAEPISQSISPWMPITDPHMLAVIGKAIEETGELTSRLARCLVAGFDEIDPDSKRTNIQELCREYSDAKAVMKYLARFEPRLKAIPERIDGKIEGFDHWHVLIDEKLAEQLADKAATASVEGHRGDGFPYS